jgi:uncharacterized membrane protein
MKVLRVARSWWRSAGLAAITGSRTALGPALAARIARSPTRLRAATAVMAALELIFDKLPRVPARTSLGGLAFRIPSAIGVALMTRPRRGRGAALGALALGVAGALFGAFAGLRLRLALTRRIGGGTLANAVAGALEDAALLALGRRLSERR